MRRVATDINTQLMTRNRRKQRSGIERRQTLDTAVDYAPRKSFTNGWSNW